MVYLCSTTGSVVFHHIAKVISLCRSELRSNSLGYALHTAAFARVMQSRSILYHLQTSNAHRSWFLFCVLAPRMRQATAET